MEPVVNGLADEYQGEIAVVSLNAEEDGKAAYKAAGAPGHPAFIMLLPDGTELWRGFGVITLADLDAVFVDALDQMASMRVVPTLNLDTIPVLGEDNPPPPVPLLANDPRYPIEPASDDTRTEGQRLYEQFCASCHAITGEGQQPDPYAPGAAPPHDDTGHTWHHADQQNFATVWTGSSVNAVMPAFFDRMTPDDIIAVLAYIKTWWTGNQLDHQMELSQQVVDGLSGR